MDLTPLPIVLICGEINRGGVVAVDRRVLGIAEQVGGCQQTARGGFRVIDGIQTLNSWSALAACAAAAPPAAVLRYFQGRASLPVW
jgi:hypothetical protein